MGIHDTSTIAVICSYRAIVRTLRTRISRRRPSERLDCKLIFLLKNRILLFYTEPGLSMISCFKDFLSKMSEICVCWLKLIELIVSPNKGLTENNNVRSFSSERIREESDGLHDYF